MNNERGGGGVEIIRQDGGEVRQREGVKVCEHQEEKRGESAKEATT